MKKADCLKKASLVYEPNVVLELEYAINYATKKHLGQKRKSGEPYITHPLSVCSILIDWGMDADTAIAGVLHDTVEDTDATLEEIETLFGHGVAFLVDGVTKVGQSRAGMRNLESYLPHTKDNLSKLLIAVGQDIRVLIIKLADRLHNMQTLQHMSREKQKKIARETLEVFAPLADRLNMGRVRVQLEELSFQYLMPHDYQSTKALIKRRLRKSKALFDSVETTVRNHLTNEKIDFTLDGRVKSIYSLYKKLDRVGDIDKIYDIMAFRIIVDDLDTCYLVLSEIHSLYKPAFHRIKDYVTRPKPNGYQSLHTTVSTEDDQHVEFQIRTKDMHEYAERGLAASFYYNEQKLTEEYRQKNVGQFPDHLTWIQDLQQAAQAAKTGKEYDASDFRLTLFDDRIFVYSPNGDIYDLPRGAYPLDFAYRIHSDIAAVTTGFIINGRMQPFTYVLQHGDTIDIKTNRNAQPKADWLNVVTTSHAKAKLRAQLRKNGVLQRISQAAAIIQYKASQRKK